MTHEHVDRWAPALAGALALVGVGLLAAQPSLLAAAVVPLAYVLYGRVSRLEGVPTLHAERTLAEPSPAPGQRVRVTLRVENRGDAVLPDVRVVDGVPDRLAVPSGSPRGADALGPGEAITCEYTVVARRGEFAFDAPVARVRSLAGTAVVTGEPSCAGDATLTCRSPLAVPAARRAAGAGPGRQPTDSGGSGQEFYGTRAYRPGDAVGRIDWRHYAKTGEFVTQQYREERAGETVILVDARSPARVAPALGHPTSADLAVYAGERLLAAHEGTEVGVVVAVLGVSAAVDDALVETDGLPWVTARGRRGWARARAMLDAAAAAAGDGPRQESGGRASDEPAATAATRAGRRQSPEGSVAGDGGVPGGGAAETNAPGADAAAGIDDGSPAGDELLERLLDRLPTTGRVVLCSPLLDDWPTELVRTLRARNRDMVVVAPALGPGGRTGAGETLGRRLARLDRQRRVQACRAVGATVVDWSPADRLPVALRRSLAAREVPR